MPTNASVAVTPLTRLNALLPKLLCNVSMARAQIAIDQLRSTIESGGIDQIVFLTLSDPEDADEPIAAAVAIVQPQGSASSEIADEDAVERGDSREKIATLVHAGPLRDARNAQDETAADETAAEAEASRAETLADAMDGELQRRGVVFLQWATDPVTELDPQHRRWCERMGMQRLATLEYLSGPVGDRLPFEAADCDELQFEVVDTRGGRPLRPFAELVQETYTETLDCPALSNHRTAAQTLAGYQASGAYNPQMWFEVTRRGADGRTKPMGCLILADHRGPTGEDASEPGGGAVQEDSAGVIEIVYMGLVPEARGNRFGRGLVRQAFAVARDAGAGRVILAVDQVNHHARRIYEAVGLSPMLKETVWAKTITEAK